MDWIKREVQRILVGLAMAVAETAVELIKEAIKSIKKGR
jgi:hypothetical protein